MTSSRLNATTDLVARHATLRDVQRPYRFPAETNSEATKPAAETIREAVQIIAQQAGIGRPVDDMEPE